MSLALRPLTSSRVWDLSQLPRLLDLSAGGRAQICLFQEKKKKSVLISLGPPKWSFCLSFLLEICCIAKETGGNLFFLELKGASFVKTFIRIAYIFHIQLQRNSSQTVVEIPKCALNKMKDKITVFLLPIHSMKLEGSLWSSEIWQEEWRAPPRAVLRTR